MVVLCPVPSVKSKSVGSFYSLSSSNTCHFTSRVKTNRLVARLYIQYIPVAEFSEYTTIISGNPHYDVLTFLLFFFATYPVIPNFTRWLNQFLILLTVKGCVEGLFQYNFNITYHKKPLQYTAYSHSFTCVYFLRLSWTIIIISLYQIKFIYSKLDHYVLVNLDLCNPIQFPPYNMTFLIYSYVHLCCHNVYIQPWFPLPRKITSIFDTNITFWLFFRNVQPRHICTFV